MQPIKFIHTADLHLGSPLKSLGQASEEIRDRLRDATFTALKRIIDAALRHEVDFVLFAGDVYDLESRSIRANRILAEELGRLNAAGISAFIIAGNHDPLGQIATEAFPLPENITVFGSEEVEIAEVRRDEEVVARVLGQSYREKTESRQMIRYFTTPDTGVWNIGLLHTALDPQGNRYVPCSVEDLKSKPDIHYWALGHIHQTRILSPGNPGIAYPGVPQGRDIGESGVGGCLLVELTPQNDPRFQFIPVSPILWEMREIVLENFEKQPESLPDLAELIGRTDRAEMEYPDRVEADIPVIDGDDRGVEGTVIRWKLTGRGPIHEVIENDPRQAAEELERTLRERFAQQKPFRWTESVQFQTGQPIQSLEELAEEHELFRDIEKIRDDLRESPELHERLLEQLGDIWSPDADEEDPDPERFAVNKEVLEDLISRATSRVVEALVERRENL